MKTAELTGPALDWAVAKCEFVPGTAKTLIWDEFKPYSTNWAQGGPIIERELIEVGRQHGEWIACSEVADDGSWDENVCYGPTPLIAALRCYVASKLGDEVEVPAELS
jgi:hypothetical protein